MKNNIFFFHGKLSSPKGTKAILIKEHHENCIIPELPQSIIERESIVLGLVKEPSWLIGSSLGGLSSILFSMKKPEMVKGMLLLAPAVGFFDRSPYENEILKRIATTYIAKNIPTIVIAGNQDETIPLQDIQKMIDRSPDKSQIEFITVNDDHRLTDSLDLMMKKLSELLETATK